MAFQRHIPLEGATNFRDFGGYETPQGAVRTGRLFRSDRLSELTPADYERIQPLGIGLVVDLRRSSELRSHPTRWPLEPLPELWHAPVFEDGQVANALHQLVADNPAARDDPAVTIAHMERTYRRMITEPFAQRQLGQIIERLGRERDPTTIIHCSGGKDRTGVVVALIQSLLGVTEPDIIDDFMLTQAHYNGEGLMRERADQILETSNVEMSREALLPVFTVRASYIRAALDEVAVQNGTPERYLVETAGVSAGAIDALREGLLED